MMKIGQFLLGLVQAKYSIGLASGSRCVEWDGPHAIGVASASNNDLVILNQVHTIFGEKSNTLVIAQLGKGDECSIVEVVEYISMLRLGRQCWRKVQLTMSLDRHGRAISSDNSGSGCGGNKRRKFGSVGGGDERTRSARVENGESG